MWVIPALFWLIILFVVISIFGTAGFVAITFLGTLAIWVLKRG